MKGPKPASFCLFSFFSQDTFSTNFTINDESIDGVLGIRTQDGRMVGADESTEQGSWSILFSMLKEL